MIPSPVSASPIIRSESVSYADLDLGTSAGQAALLLRTNAASGRVCVDLSAMGTLGPSEASALCAQQAQTLTAVRLIKIMKVRKLGG